MEKWYSLGSGGNKTKLTTRSLLMGSGVLTILTILSGGVLLSQSGYAATNSTDSSNVSVIVNSACTMKGGSSGTDDTGNSTYSATIDPGTVAEINGSKLTTICNDPNGYSVYAIGYSNNAYTTPTNTQMIGANGNINTGTNTSGDNSSWSMKLAAVSGVTPPTILNNFNNYHVIPSTYTQIAKYTSSTSSGTAAGAQVQAKYQVYISSGQLAGTYTGKVKYTMVHPNDAAAPTIPITLDAIATDSNTHYMQESINCASSTIGTVATLTDNRDGQIYKVAKAADGNCWMIQNLKLGKTTSTLTLTPTNSDVGSNYVLDNKLPSPGKFHAYTIDGVQYQNNSTEYYCTDAYGCYYNWYTATAGTGTTYISTQGQNVNNSICPAGWTLPTSGSGGQFQALYNQYPSATQMLVDDPTTATENTAGKIPGFLLGGGYYTGGANNVGVYGLYWSRTASSAQSGYFLSLGTSSVYPSGSGSKYFGRAVRCVLQQ